MIQIFDSWSGLLPFDEFEKFSIQPMKKIVTAMKKYDSNIPIIGFPRGAGHKIEDYAHKTNITALQCDESVNMALIAQENPNIILQGNMDPLVLLGDDQQLINKIHVILNQMKQHSFIFNLGHGISKETNPEKISLLVKTIREFKNE